MKVLRIGLLAISLALLTACGNYVEEFTLKADGSGTYTVYTDIVSGSIEMATNMATMFSDEEMSKEQMDSLKLIVSEKIWEDFPGEIDSVLNIAGELPDSFLNYGNNREYAERMVMYMRGSREKGYVNAGIEIDFKDGEDYIAFSEYFENMQNAKSGDDSGNSTMLSSLSNTKSNATYSFEKNGFKRSVKYTFQESEEGAPSLDKMMNMLGEDGTYQTIIKTERKIKKVKGDYIKSQEDYKVIFEYPFAESLNGSINTDFEIVFH